MPDKPCPGWEYGYHPDAAVVLPSRAADILADLKQHPDGSEQSMRDTRPFHKTMFSGLTPPSFDHYAGHYRGEILDCLKEARVKLTNNADPRVGFEPDWVHNSMKKTAEKISDILFEMDMLQLEDPAVPRDEFLVKAVEHSCEVFESFLEIHPYINGNGHMGRFIIIALLGRYGFWMKDWEIHQRPKEPEYSECIKLHRDGQVTFLQRLILQQFV
jgi:hypothetical protein